MFSINDKFIVTVTFVNNKIAGRSILDVRLCDSVESIPSYVHVIG